MAKIVVVRRDSLQVPEAVGGSPAGGMPPQTAESQAARSRHAVLDRIAAYQAKRAVAAAAERSPGEKVAASGSDQPIRPRNQRATAAKPETAARDPSAREARVAAEAGLSMADLCRAKRMCDQLGGLQQARELLDALEQLMD